MHSKRRHYIEMPGAALTRWLLGRRLIELRADFTTQPSVIRGIRKVLKLVYAHPSQLLVNITYPPSPNYYFCGTSFMPTLPVDDMISLLKDNSITLTQGPGAMTAIELLDCMDFLERCQSGEAYPRQVGQIMPASRIRRSTSTYEGRRARGLV